MLQVVGGWLSGTEAALLLAVLGLATLGTTALFLVGLVGYHRRRTTVYLLLTLALGLLVSRSIVGFGTAMGVVPMSLHHIIEHGTDFAIAAVVLYALYRTGPPTETV